MLWAVHTIKKKERNLVNATAKNMCELTRGKGSHPPSILNQAQES